MNTKRKIGIILILVGIGLPLVLYFFQTDGEITLKEPQYVERVLAQDEKQKMEEAKRKYEASKKESNDEWAYLLSSEYPLKVPSGGVVVPYKYSIGIGLIIELLGIGFLTFSFFPNKKA